MAAEAAVTFVRAIVLNMGTPHKGIITINKVARVSEREMVTRANFFSNLERGGVGKKSPALLLFAFAKQLNAVVAKFFLVLQKSSFFVLLMRLL